MLVYSLSIIWSRSFIISLCALPQPCPFISSLRVNTILNMCLSCSFSFSFTTYMCTPQIGLTFLSFIWIISCYILQCALSISFEILYAIHVTAVYFLWYSIVWLYLFIHSFVSVDICAFYSFWLFIFYYYKHCNTYFSVYLYVCFSKINTE